MMPEAERTSEGPSRVHDPPPRTTSPGDDPWASNCNDTLTLGLPHIFSSAHHTAASCLVPSASVPVHSCRPPSLAMSHSPTPRAKQQSDSNLPFYSSRPTLDVPAIGDDGRPPPVKYMYVVAASMTSLPRPVLTSEQVHARISKSLTAPQASCLVHTTRKGANSSCVNSSVIVSALCTPGRAAMLIIWLSGTCQRQAKLSEAPLRQLNTFNRTYTVPSH